MIYVGIDGGLKGGLTFLSDSGEILLCRPLPTNGNTYDINKLDDLFFYFLAEKEFRVMLEFAHTMPLNGAKANFTNGGLFYSMQTFLQMKKYPYQLVKAVTWQKEIFKGITAIDTKQASINYCLHKYPNFDFKATDRCKINHDGMTDSCCIANYCKDKW